MHADEYRFFFWTGQEDIQKFPLPHGYFLGAFALVDPQMDLSLLPFPENIEIIMVILRGHLGSLPVTPAYLVQLRVGFVGDAFIDKALHRLNATLENRGIDLIEGHLMIGFIKAFCLPVACIVQGRIHPAPLYDAFQVVIRLPMAQQVYFFDTQNCSTFVSNTKIGYKPVRTNMAAPDITLDQLNALCKNTLAEALGIEFTEVGADYICGRMPVDQRTHQPMGLLHGGASVALAETLGSVGASLQVDQARQACVGLEINANHIKSVRHGFVLGRATAVHIGRKTQVWEIRITTETNGELVCISRITVAVLDRAKG